jgi:hypothetical protein
LVLLAFVSSQLTIHGRSFGLDLSGEEQISAFKGLNELQHQISFHLVAIGLGAKRYPDDVFLQILLEKAPSFGLSAYLAQSLDQHDEPENKSGVALHEDWTRLLQRRISPLLQRVPGTPSAPMQSKMALRGQLMEVLLQCISARAGQLHDVSDRDPAVFARVFEDAYR